MRVPLKMLRQLIWTITLGLIQSGNTFVVFCQWRVALRGQIADRASQLSVTVTMTFEFLYFHVCEGQVDEQPVDQTNRKSVSTCL